MIPLPDSETLSALPAKSIRGTFFRALLPSFARDPLSVQGSLRHGGRYNPSGIFGALYCGESPAVCVAEIRRRAAGQPVFPYRLARIRIQLHRVLDLTEPVALMALGLRSEDLIGDDWQRTQQLAARARAAGYEGLLVPSAAGPGRNLVIFADRLHPRSRVRAVASRPFALPPES